MSFNVHGRRLTSGAIGAVIVLALAATPVLAETELRREGRIGEYQLNDSSVSPAVTCVYDEDNGHLLGFHVNTPTIWARDKTGGEDTQKVGWKVIVKRLKDTASQWKTILKTTTIKADATDNVSAFFPRWEIFPTIPTEQIGRYSEYFIVTRAIWFRADGTVAGYAQARYDNYEWQVGEAAPTPGKTSCVSDLLI